MDEIVAIADLETRFPGQWILLDQPETDEKRQVIRGGVVWHSEDRVEVYRRALELPQPRNFAFRCTNKRPPGTVCIL